MKSTMRSKMRSSIMAKFIVPTALIILGGVGLCAWLLSNYDSDQIHESTQELMSARVEQTMSTLTSTHSLMKDKVDVAMRILLSEGRKLGHPPCGEVPRSENRPCRSCSSEVRRR